MLSDGSRRRLVDIASHYNLGYVVLLVSSSFDCNQSAEAQENGAFDVLDLLHELPKVAEVTKRALWAAYLKGAGPSPDVAGSPKGGMILMVFCDATSRKWRGLLLMPGRRRGNCENDKGRMR